MIVLFGLSVVTALYAISSTLTVSTAVRNSVDLKLATAASERVSMVNAALAALPDLDPVTDVATIHGSVEMREVSGLIDLNTASRPLLETFFSQAEISSEEANRFFRWRSSGLRLLRIEDLFRILERPHNIPNLHRLVTVYSGLQGVSVDAVTDDLQTLMQWSNGPPDQFIAPLRGIVYAIYDEETARYAGTISALQTTAVVLDLR